jgi:hypothetical protein
VMRLNWMQRQSIGAFHIWITKAKKVAHFRNNPCRKGGGGKAGNGAECQNLNRGNFCNFSAELPYIMLLEMSASF